MGIFPAKFISALSNQQKKVLEAKATPIGTGIVRFDNANFHLGDFVGVNNGGHVGLFDGNNSELIGVAVSKKDVLIQGKAAVNVKYDIKFE